MSSRTSRVLNPGLDLDPNPEFCTLPLDQLAARVSLARKDSIDVICYAHWLKREFQYWVFKIGTGYQSYWLYLHCWLLIIINQCELFQTRRICFRLRFNHAVRILVRSYRSLLAVRQCLVGLLRLRQVWLKWQRLMVVRWLPGYLPQLVGCQIWLFLLQRLCRIHYYLWMWCNLWWFLSLVGNFCHLCILLPNHNFFVRRFYRFFWSDGFWGCQRVACCKIVCCTKASCNAAYSCAGWGCASHCGLVKFLMVWHPLMVMLLMSYIRHMIWLYNWCAVCGWNFATRFKFV